MIFNLKDLLLSLLLFFPIVCIKAETQQLTVTIPISGSIAIENIDIKIPLYKYNKDFAISFTGDDALLGIYQRPFNYALGKYVDDKDIFHESASVPTSGITPQRMLTFSDGCGNDIPFRFGINWIASKDGKDIHKNGNVWLANMWWSEAERFTDFGNSIMNHGGAYDNTDPIASINKTYEGVKDTLEIAPFVLGIPGGSTGFPEASLKTDKVYFVESSSFSINYKKYIVPQIFEAATFYKGKFPRKCLDGTTIDEIKEIIEEGISNKHWTNLFCHNIKNSTEKVNGQLNTDACFAMLDYIYDNYGTAGKDNAWVTGTAEIFEYQYARLNSSIKKEIVGSNLVITIEAATLPDFHVNELSLIISGVNTSDVRLSSNITVASWATEGNRMLLNLGFSQRAVSIAEKYVARAETLRTEESIKEALLHTQCLAPTIKAPFIERIAKLSSVDNIKTKSTFHITGTTNSTIIIDGELTSPITIFSIDGTIFTTIPTGLYAKHQIYAHPGIYITQGKKIAVM